MIIVPLAPEPANAVEALWLAALRADTREHLVIDAGESDRAAMGPDPMSGATAPLAVAAGRARAALQISPCRAA